LNPERNKEAKKLRGEREETKALKANSRRRQALQLLLIPKMSHK
jgi:hypothetical protein